MEQPIPDSLRRLLDTRDDLEFKNAWRAFLELHSELLVRVAKTSVRGHDDVMDRYVFVLEALQRDRCQRLRSWTPIGHGRFDTWLIVVARRLCFDFHRQRYGRLQSDIANSVDRHAERRNLADLVSDEFGLDQATAPEEDAPDLVLQREELRRALTTALARLDHSDRLLLRFRFEDGLSVPDIARLQGAPSPFVVYRRLDRILGTLRRWLLDAGIMSPTP